MNKRELKFRIWNVKTKKFLDEDPFYSRWAVSLDGKVFNGRYDCKYEEDEYAVQQFSGLKDKNGKEIYEGDILVENHDGSEGEANIGQVFFAAGTFMINGDGTLYDHVHSFSPDILEDYTVEGNIFENPELLNK